MKCEDARDLISDWVDGEIDADSNKLLEAHLRVCGKCRKYSLVLHEKVRAVFSTAAPVEVPSDLWQGIVAAIEAADRAQRREEEVVIDIATGKKRLRFWMLAGALAAMLVAVVLVDIDPGNKGAISGMQHGNGEPLDTQNYASLYAFDVSDDDPELGTAVETLLI